MTAVTPQYESDWRTWHAARIADLTGPYGWIAMVSQDWLTPGVPLRVDEVPGSWLLEDDTITYVPDGPGPGRTVAIDGEPATGPVVVPHGHKYSTIPIEVDGLRVETIRRTDERGGRIYGVRVRDPREARRRRFTDIETFPLDADWAIPARFTRTPDRQVEAPTVEDGVLEARLWIGTVSLEIAGRPYTLQVGGRPDDHTGVLAGSVHFTDATSGRETYGNGRLVPVPGIEADGDTVVDFNRAYSFPCAFTNYVTCPLAPAANRLPVAVAAGEKNPPTHVERIQTFRRAS